jgi:hypothetical protein
MKLVQVQHWEDIKSIVEECFSGDEDLLNKYHIKAGRGLDECVADTYNVLKMYTAFDFEFYKIDDDGLVGFIGVEPSIRHLTTFCLKKQCRTKENKWKLWEMINSFFEKGFMCGIYKRNSRAIKFLTDNGCVIFKETEINGHPIVVIDFKKEVICR